MNTVQQSVRRLQRVALPLARIATQTKPFSAQATRSSGVDNALFASGEAATSLKQTLQTLVGPAGRWTLTHDGTGIQRHFQFKSFKAAWVMSTHLHPYSHEQNTDVEPLQTFMNDIAGQCRTHKHHPEWSNIYDKVFVRWTTHNPRGLSNNDLKLANVCDKFASRDETMEVGGKEGGKDGKLEDLTGQAAGSSSVSGGKAQEEAKKQEEKAKIEKEEEESGKEGSLAGIGGQPT